MDSLKAYLRLATLDDMDRLFVWRNEENVRENSFCSQSISHDEHKKWLDRTLKEENTWLYILMSDNKVIGQVRLEVKDSIGFISYSIGSQYRYMGYGKIIIQLIENQVLTLGMVHIKLAALVKKDNIASQRIFEKLNYQGSSQEKWIMYTKIRLTRWNIDKQMSGGGTLSYEQ